jgi:NitT/TauT family transport system substrate-binding protein
MKRRFLNRLAAGATALGLVAIVSLGTKAQAADVVTVGYVPVSEAAPIFLGIEKGFFAAENLKVETTVAQGGPAMIAGTTSGTVNVALSAPVPMIQARNANIRLVALAVARAAKPGSDEDGVIVKSDSPFRVPKDLNGHTVGILGLKSAGELETRATMDQLGGDSSTLKFVEIPMPDIWAAVDAGRIDAGALNEPFFSSALKKNTRSLFNFMDANQNRMVTVWFTNEAQLKAKPQLFERFTRALDVARRFAATNPDDVRRIIPSFSRITPEQAREIRLPTFELPLSQEDFRFNADLMVKYKFLAAVPDLSGMVR